MGVTIYVFFLMPPDPQLQEYAMQQEMLKNQLSIPTIRQSSFITDFQYDVDTVRGVECSPKHFQSTQIEALSDSTARVTGVATAEFGGTWFMPRTTTYEQRTYTVKKNGSTYQVELDVTALGEAGAQCHVLVTLTSQNTSE
jgi:hypothetical protein